MTPSPTSGFATDQPKTLASVRPSVFLMIESLDTGGSERQFCELARGLHRQRFDVQLGCIRQRGAFADEFGAMPQFRLGGSLYGLQSLRTRFRLARYLRRSSTAVVHAFDFYSNMTLIPAARLARVPVVIGSQRQIGDLLSSKQSLAQMAMFRLCDAVICNSRAAADALVAAGLPDNRVAVIGNALAPEAFAAVTPALPRQAGVIRVAMVARMNARYKNHHVLLQAAARLVTQFPSLEIVLAGDGPLRPELERLADNLGIRSQVQFLGDRRDIAAILASVDVSVVPSASESLSNVALESMAAGVPVVATRVGGNPELINEQRGLLVPSDDAEALASALARVLSDSAGRAAMGEAGRRFTYENFRREQIVAKYQELYDVRLERKNWKPRVLVDSTRKKLRVAIIAPTLRFVGGQAVQADLLLKQWQNDPDVYAYFVAVDPSFPRGLRWAEIVPLLRTIIRQPIYLLSLWRELKHCDVAHIFSASYWSFLLAPAPAWLIARLRGKKTVINYRSGEARDHLTRFRTAVPVLRGADMLVVPSGYLVDVFREFGLAAQVVPNIVDLSQFSFRERKPLRPHLICTRGFRPYYCIDTVVRAFAEVQKVYPEAKLDLVGDGPLEQQIRNLAAELGLRGINFAGVASRQQIGRYYDAADIFINASRLDNMPVSVIEAFAAGTPVVTTSPESMPYLVEHGRTGLLSEPGAVMALANNVVRLLSDEGLASHLAHQAYEQSRRYRWAAVRRQWLEVYQALCPAGNSVSRELHRMKSEMSAISDSDSVQVRR